MRLKDNPREWKKFIWLYSFVAIVLAALAYRKQRISAGTLESILVAGICCGVLALFKPVLFRPIYRICMGFFGCVGNAMGKALLTILYFLLLVPLAFILRFAGKDLLELKRAPGRKSYWKTPRRTGSFDQQF